MIEPTLRFERWSSYIDLKVEFDHRSNLTSGLIYLAGALWPTLTLLLRYRRAAGISNIGSQGGG